MTPERYRQVGELYHAALQIEAGQREAFLDKVCAGDEELRREVESLIESSERASKFIKTPALAVAAKLLAQDEPEELIGRTLARYRIVSLIGSGGMGRVYLANDTMLGRRVALKLLPEHFTSDRNQVQRFRQEARAVSALNHPNILTVHEVGQVDGMEFIATEFVEGETLRTRLSRGSLSVQAALVIAVQIADALTAAHDAGIIHRDIKPENVMIRRDGYVKVLDFGLAKLAENLLTLQPSELEAPTKAAIKTNPGMVMGTAEYMSPEQARGLSVDARTDIWSFGVVLYEMVTAQRPFTGPTHGDTVVEILERDPQSLLRVMPDSPPELDRIITKALAKDADARYQTINDMKNDLRQLRRRLEIATEVERSGDHDSSNNSPAQINHVVEGQPGDTEVFHARASQNVAAQGTSSLEYAVSEITKHKGMALTIGFVLLLLVGGGIFALYTLLSPRSTSLAPFQSTQMTRLTGTGKALDAAISPDGKYLVYAELDAGQQSLWVKQVATGSTVQIISAEECLYWGLTFSNDGNYVYYVRSERNNPRNFLYQIPSLGGVSKKLIEHVDSAVAFSPDGKRLAFIRDFLKRQENALVIANADGSNEQTLATRKSPKFFWSDVAVRISWSPDGKTVACPGRNQAKDGDFREGYYYDVVVVSVGDGSEKSLSSYKWSRVQQVTWMADGNGLVMTAAEEAGASSQLYYLSYPGGQTRKITNDLNNYSDVTLTTDSTLLATVQRNRVSNVWVTPNDITNSARQITSGTLDGYGGLAWTPDGRIVYRSDASGSPHIWIMDADGKNQKQLTHDGQYDTKPTVTADGRYIVFASQRDGRVNVWRMNTDGNNQKQLSNGKTNSNPYVSPDGRWVVYASWDHGNATLWKVPIDGGTPVQVSGPTANLPVVSPDGKMIACFYWDEQATPTRGAMILPADGGEPLKRFNIRTGRDGFALAWATDGKSLLFPRNISNIWSQPIDGSDPVKVTDFSTDQVFNFSYSFDGKWLAAARGRVTDDVVLIRDQR